MKQEIERFTTLLIILLSILMIFFNGCSPAEDTVSDLSRIEWMRRQAFTLNFNEAGDIQTALDTSKYLIVAGSGMIIPIDSVGFITKVSDGMQWHGKYLGISKAVAVKQLYNYAGQYIIELNDVADTIVTGLQPNSTLLRVYYTPFRVEYFDITDE